MPHQWGALSKICVQPRTETFNGSPITSKDQTQGPQYTQPTSLTHPLASLPDYLPPLSTALDSLYHTLLSKHNIQNMLTYSPHALIPQFLQLNLVTPF